MAATGYTPIQLYYSTTTGNTPLLANLANGELAINTYDGKLFYKNTNTNTVTLLAQSSAASPVTSISFGSTGLTPATATTGAVTVAGTLGTGYGGTGSTSTTYCSLTTNVTGTLPIGNGGTGQTTASAAFNALSPITSTGDLILGNGTNSATRLAIGSNNYVLTSNGTTASWAAIPASSLTVGTTTISSGTSGYILYNNAGVLGNLATTGSGNVVLATSPTLTTPTLGVASATSINKVALTAPATGSTLTILDGKTLTANNSITLAGTDSTTMTFPSTSATVAGLGITQTFTGTQTFSGSTSILAQVVTNSAEVTTVSATAATGTINYDISTQSVLYYTTSASANWTVNFRFSSGTSLNTAMSTGQAITVVFLVSQGATAYYNNAVTIDGASVTPKYQGGTAWSSGNASGIDAYSYTIVKTGSATFTVFASQTQFK